MRHHTSAIYRSVVWVSVRIGDASDSEAALVVPSYYVDARLHPVFNWYR